MIAAWKVPQENPKREYISRDAAKEFLYRAIDADAEGECKKCVRFPFCMYTEFTLDELCKGIERTINEIPAADVQKVKCGYWEMISPKEWIVRCSRCKSFQGAKTPYCPICGARMEG